MSKFSKTDRELSLAANEFQWDVNDFTDAHRFVISPIIRALKAHSARKVLDLGCGNGVLTSQLSQAGFDVVGLDASKSGIGMARANFPGIPFDLHDLNEPIPEAHTGVYDAVLAVEVIEHLLLPRSLLRSAVECARPGGLVLITTPYHGYLKNLALALTNKFDFHWHPLRDYGHVKFFSKRTILSLFNEFGLTNPRIETVGRIPAFARSMMASGLTPSPGGNLR